jgi:UDPglucose 6-dehydrogenase
MKKVAVVGYGYVGKAIADFFKDHFEVIAYDPFVKASKVENGITLSHDKNEVNRCDLAVVSVPTPMGKNGVVDLSIINEVMSWLDTKHILVKSTVPPGTVKNLIKKTGKKIAFSPEYIGEGKYEVFFWKGYPDPTNMKRHEFMIIGGERKTTSAILEFFKTVLGAEPVYLQTDSTTAELAKYMENSFLATKVTFCNEFKEIADAFGVDYDELRELWLRDGRMGRSHTAVFKDKRGFGGKCLPKDVNGIVKASEAAGYTPKLIKEVLASNKRFVAKNK